MYDDDYPTCAKTYATLCMYPGEMDPSSVTERLGIEPKEWQRRGEPTHRAGRPPRIPAINGWFLRTKGHVESRDSRRHVDWLLDRVLSRADAIQSLRVAGCGMNIFCDWLSPSGHGGPMVSTSRMKRLAELDIELWFDFYGPYEENEA